MDLSLISIFCPVSSKPKLQFHDVSCCYFDVDGYLISDLVSPLLDGLNDGLDDGSLLDLSWGWDGVGVLDSSWGSSDGWGGDGSSSIRVGEGSVEENLGLGGSRGKSENNRLQHGVCSWFGSEELTWLGRR